ncbi:MAG: site-specific integrase [Ferruginibacter sp.]|nr:site-specific integrase [Ferruginibacter sp.]
METQVSVVLDTRREKKDGLYPLKLRVYFQGKAVLYPLIYDLTKIDFEKLDAKRVSDSLSKIRENIGNVEMQAKIALNKIVPFDFEKFSKIFILDNEFFRKKSKPLKTELFKQNIIDDIPAEWRKKFSIFKEISSGPDFISQIFYSIIKSLLYQARIGTADNYQTSYNSLKAFRGNVRLSEITPRFLKEYEGWMTNEKGNSKTTVSMYTRCIRAALNEAIENKLMKREDYPFGKRRYIIPMGRNIKKALNKESISKLYYSDIEMENQQKAKDFWFFSFYGNGMNVKDIICLKYKNIKGEFLVFERAKTELTNRGGEPIIISCFLNKDMLDIIERWGNKDKNPENYVFPILSVGLSPIRQFEIKQNFTRFINKNMAKVSEKAMIDKKVKTMECRHSASTLMKNAGVSPHYIKEALGHASLKTTENYLAGFENNQKKEFSKVLDDFKKTRI